MDEPPQTLPEDDKADIRPSLRALESNKESNQVSADQKPLYNPAVDTAGRQSAFKKMTDKVKNNPRKSLLGAATGSSIIGIIFAAFLSLIPLKVEFIVKNLENRFMAGPQLALSKENEKLLSQYLKKYVLPGLAACSGTTTDKSCKPKAADQLGSNPVRNLYTSWSQAKLETKLATDYHIEFRRDSASGRYFMKAPGIGGVTGEDITSHVGPGDTGDLFKEVSRNEIRSQVRTALAGETKYKRVYKRYKVGRLLESKYGVRRCLFFCGTRDALADHVGAQKRAAQLFLVDRVLIPRNKTLGIAVKCLLSQCTANGDDKLKPSDGKETPALNGTSESRQTEVGVRRLVDSEAGAYGAEDIAKIIGITNELADKGLEKYLIKQGLVKLGVKSTLAGSAADKIPILGYINMADQVVEAAKVAGPDIKKLGYLVNVVAAIKLAAMYQSYADEIHKGHVTMAEVGSMNDSFNSGDVNNKQDPIVGGTATAEQAPLYSYLIDNQAPPSTPVASTSSNPLSFVGTAYAAGATTSSNSTYICKDKKPVPVGKLICNEEALGAGNGLANGLSGFISNVPGLVTIADAWKNTLGKVFGAINFIAGSAIGLATSSLDKECSLAGAAGKAVEYSVPGAGAYCAVKDGVTKLMPIITKGIVEYLIPNAWDTNMSGGRKFQLAAAGFDAMGSESAHVTLGGQKLSPTQSAAILNDQQSLDKIAFDSQPLSKRLFDTSNQRSLVTQVALSLPFNSSSTARLAFTNFITHPFAFFGDTFAKLFSPQVSAAATPIDDPFGITQYGYPAGSISDDPSAYWDANCSDNQAQGYQNDAQFNSDANWSKQAAANPDESGQPTNTTTNQCLLIKSTVGSSGGLYNTDLLTKDDLASPNSN